MHLARALDKSFIVPRLYRAAAPSQILMIGRSDIETAFRSNELVEYCGETTHKLTLG